GFFLIPDHAKGGGHEEHAESAAHDAKTEHGQHEADHAKAQSHDEHEHDAGHEEHEELLKEPLPEDQREVTAVLIRTASIGGAPPELVAPDLVKHVNKEFVAQAIEPIKEITVLTNTFVKPLQIVLLILTVLIVIVAGVGILVSIYNS